MPLETREKDYQVAVAGESEVCQMTTLEAFTILDHFLLFLELTNISTLLWWNIKNLEHEVERHEKRKHY